METHVTREVYALKPTWVHHEKNRYRLYINEDLLTERDWIWELNTSIEEDIWVDLDPAVTNNIRLEPLIQPNSVAQFGLRTLRVNGWPKPDGGGDKLEVSIPLQ